MKIAKPNPKTVIIEFSTLAHFLWGEKYIIDGNEGIIKKDNYTVVRFNEVKVSEILGKWDETSEYSFYIITHGGKRVHIHSDQDANMIRRLAREFAAVLQVEVIEE